VVIKGKALAVLASAMAAFSIWQQQDVLLVVRLWVVSCMGHVSAGNKNAHMSWHFDTCNYRQCSLDLACAVAVNDGWLMMGRDTNRAHPSMMKMAPQWSSLVASPW